jgi:hypothetical protein
MMDFSRRRKEREKGRRAAREGYFGIMATGYNGFGAPGWADRGRAIFVICVCGTLPRSIGKQLHVRLYRLILRLQETA